ncbi:ABC transporter substrate-binding protein (plasmid) [Azospirillum baldaniorum]|uniref:Periplasmic binding protein n=1 Tax=Azospirillum baldaniorum TaxID=1064539 RepID=A0A9P1JVK2_9PROT|nr:ABC transporter substrate-binding protein [Azospirillum baldaniorum]AWJ92160.1 ABC transporter substrate-binding protein [Azospirillum baldaniorum]TWA73576.1 iron complex transport system substrate-binding protein [Azospirillum brasilense]CCD00643.1 periplasmic binding protein [Azospirillum baldaniorum]
MRPTFVGLAAALLLIAGGPAAAWEAPPAKPPSKPQRIVSLNLCADELLLRLVGPERLAAVTWLARDPRASTVAALALRVPVNHGTAEQILPLNPDLIVAGRYTTRVAVGLLTRLDAPLLELDVPQSVAGVAEQIRGLARAVGEPDRGEALVADLLSRLDALPAAAPGPRPTAVVLRPNGFVAGSGSLVDELLTRAGLENMADRLPLGSQGALPLEAIILGGADVLIVDAAPDAPPSLAGALLHHPALKALKRQVRTVSLPSRLWTCPGPQIAEAAERLAAAREALP